MPGTDGASFPFWSPDGRFVAFFAQGKLKKVDVALGRPQVLCDVPSGRGGAWSPSGVIVFGQSVSPLSQVPADGGPVTPATSFDAAQEPAWHYWPQFLPDGRHFIYLQRSLKPEYQGVYVASLDSPGAVRLINTDVRAQFASGYLLFIRDGLLFAQALDERTLQLSGEAVRIGENIGYYASAFGHAALDVSSRGAVVVGPPLPVSRQLQSLDRRGVPTGRAFDGAIASPRLSSDGAKLLITIRDSGNSNSDIWLFDLARGLPSRITFHPSTNYFPVWMPDGARVAFATSRAPSNQGSIVIFKKSISGSGTEEPLDSSAHVRAFPDDVSADGRVMLLHNLTSHGYDVQALDLHQAGARPSDLLSTPFNEAQARFSPDGHWVAYASDETGRFEVYARAFPSGTERIPISVGGGMQPEWRRDGKELFYLAPGGEMTAVPVTLTGTSVRFGMPQALFKVDVAEPAAPFPNDYAVSADGQRFYVTTVAMSTTEPTLTLMLNWTSALRKTQ